MAVHISNITPKPAERVITFGTTRAGKSSLMEWEMRTIQAERPHCCQIIVDSKPRFRAETMRGPLRRGRRSAAHLYEDWAKGPVVPNSVLIDIWDEQPFKGLFASDRPGEVAIMQSGEGEDWIRMLWLLKKFVGANIKGRERRIVVDECLDFTRGQLLASILRMMSSTELFGQVGREISGASLERTGCMGFLHLSFKCPLESICSISNQTLICVIFNSTAAFLTPYRQKVTTYSGNGLFNLEVLCHSLSLVG